MPDQRSVIRVFLDANILISASLSSFSQFRVLWWMDRVRPITSSYAILETLRHVEGLSHARLGASLQMTDIVWGQPSGALPSGVDLVAKDAPILAGAIQSKADWLLTGDKRHFRHLYGQTISGVHIGMPADFLRFHEDRQPPPRVA